jgi:hypothetical protein
MQIFEITQYSLQEAPPRPLPPQAAALKQRRQAMAQNAATRPQAQQPTGTTPAAAAAPAAPGQGLLGRAAQAAKAAFGNQAAQAAQNTDMLGKAMVKQWNMKAAQLAQAAAATGAGTVSDSEYKEQLEDFVERNMLQKQIDELDPTSTQRVNQMIDKVLAARNNAGQLDQAFRDMAKITTTARMDPSLRRFGGRAAAAPAAAGQPGAQQAPQATAQSLVPSSQQFNNILAHFGGRGAQFRTTGNANVDAFLAQMGLRQTT